MYDDDKGSYSGSAYVFEKGADGAVTQLAKLTAADGAASDHFGSVRRGVRLPHRRRREV